MMIYPSRYYYRGGVSDKNLILLLMEHIPAHKQKEVSDKYELLYLQDGPVSVAKGRKEANEYLQTVANHYKGERTPDALAGHMRKMLEMAKEKQDKKYQQTASGVIIKTQVPKNGPRIQLDWKK
jgi:hypothetical protein